MEVLWASLMASAFFIVQLSHLYMTTGKTIALTRWTFVGKVMSLLFNMLSRFIITFLPRSKHLLISWLQSSSAVILEPQKIKSAIVSTVSLSIFHEVMGPDAMVLVFWMLSFKPTYSLSSFSFIKRHPSSSSLSTIRVVSSAYLRLLIFLLAILIPACASSSPAFLMMYSAYKLNKTLESPLDYKEIQPVHPKGNQFWEFIGRTDVEVETPVFGHLMRTDDSFEKTLILGKIEGRRRRGQQRMRW